MAYRTVRRSDERVVPPRGFISEGSSGRRMG
jgi:hypothetical protein